MVRFRAWGLVGSLVRGALPTKAAAGLLLAVAQAVAIITAVPVTVVPELVTVVPELVAVVPELVAVVPEQAPVTVVPELVAVVPELVAVVPEQAPVTVVPELVAVVPEQAQVTVVPELVAVVPAQVRAMLARAPVQTGLPILRQSSSLPRPMAHALLALTKAGVPASKTRRRLTVMGSALRAP